MSPRPGKCWRSSSTKAWVEPESNQTSQMSSTFFQSSLACEPRKRSRAPSMYQASAPSCMKASAMRWLTISSCRISAVPSLLLADEHRDRHAPGALARDHPVGLAVDHAVDAVLARRRHPLRDRDRVQRAGAQRVAGFRLAIVGDVLVHRDEPLRRVAEDHRLLRAPGMRILMLEPSARQQHAASTSALITASLASPFSPLSLMTRLPVKPGAWSVKAPFSSTV